MWVRPEDPRGSFMVKRGIIKGFHLKRLILGNTCFAYVVQSVYFNVFGKCSQRAVL